MNRLPTLGTRLVVKDREIPLHGDPELLYAMCCDDDMAAESHTHGEDGHEFPTTRQGLLDLADQIYGFFRS